MESSRRFIGEGVHRRKVQKTGGSTYFVTLPKGWAESVGIKPGVEVTLMPTQAGTLLLDARSSSRIGTSTGSNAKSSHATSSATTSSRSVAIGSVLSSAG
jgi:hypothetical protein